MLIVFIVVVMCDGDLIGDIVEWFDFFGVEVLYKVFVGEFGIEVFFLELMIIEEDVFEGFLVKLIYCFEVFFVFCDEKRFCLVIVNLFDFNVIDLVVSVMNLEVIVVLLMSEVIYKLSKDYLGVGVEIIDGLIVFKKD